METIGKLLVTWFILLATTSIVGMCTEGNNRIQKVLVIIAIILSGLLVLSLLMLIWMI